MNSFWGNSHASRAQVLADIDSVMTAILKYCEDNMDSFTQEERLSFMNEHYSLSGVQFNEGATLSALLQALDDCKKLKLRIETAYIRHLIIRGTVSPAATTAMGGCYLPSLSLRTECHKSTQTDSTLAPSTELVDPNPTITTVDPRAQVLADIDSVMEAILEYFTDNWDSLTQEQRLSFEDECFSLSGVQFNKGATLSALLQALDDCKKLKLRIETACTKHQVDDIKRTLACRAETTTGIEYEMSEFNYLHRLPSSSDSTVSSCNAEPHKTPSNTSAGSNTSPASTKKRTWPRAPPTDSDCMIFGGDSFVGSPTFNIDSEGAIGAILEHYYGDSPSSGGSGARETSSITPPRTCTTFGPRKLVSTKKMNGQHTSSTFTGCMIVGENSSVKGATVNIGSVGESGSRTLYYGNSPSVQVSKKNGSPQPITGRR
ncbi:hypothetical protein P692DRAFT_201867272 [Suillus brevipes Sb2]|nr:hypothetical protein P692DRAFT_201867272 [Suillus brevipes Sb2]